MDSDDFYIFEPNGDVTGNTKKEDRQSERQSEQPMSRVHERHLKSRSSRQVFAEGQADKGIGLDPFTLHLTYSPQRQRHWRAREALRNLKSSPSQTGPQWTPEHHRILSENVRLLLDATSDPNAADDEDDGDDEYEDEDYDDNYEYDNAGEDASFLTQSGKRQKTAAEQRPPGQGAATGPSEIQNQSYRGRKRQREENPRDTNGFDANIPTAESLRPLKKFKLRTDVTQHVLEDLANLRPQPLQLLFPAHPHEDRSDEWFIAQFRKLFRRISRFAHDYFGLHDIDAGEFHQPWAAGMTLEFLRYVEQVAEADEMIGSWDKLLHNTAQREWLIVAVITRILEIHVFGADLWGADTQEKELLLGLERALLTREGFSRTALRSKAVRTIIGMGAITKHFHTEVAQLTARVALLLKPLTFFLYSRPPVDGRPNRIIEDQYQALHNIIAIAAYLSICIRLSSTIFYFSSVTPNTPFDPEDQYSVETGAYIRSKEAVVNAYLSHRAAYQEKKEELEREIAKLDKGGKGATSRAGKKAQAKLIAHVRTQPHPPGQTHRALTKIGVWPSIRRFKPGTQEDDEDEVPLENRNGFRIFEVSKSAVVCYFGVENRAEGAGAGVRLATFVENKMKKHGTKEQGIGKGIVLAAAAAAIAGLPYLLYGRAAGP